jgi:hypothetical protein
MFQQLLAQVRSMKKSPARTTAEETNENAQRRQWLQNASSADRTGVFPRFLGHPT